MVCFASQVTIHETARPLVPTSDASGGVPSGVLQCGWIALGGKPVIGVAFAARTTPLDLSWQRSRSVVATWRRHEPYAVGFQPNRAHRALLRCHLLCFRAVVDGTILPKGFRVSSPIWLPPTKENPGSFGCRGGFGAFRLPLLVPTSAGLL